MTGNAPESGAGRTVQEDAQRLPIFEFGASRTCQEDAQRLPIFEFGAGRTFQEDAQRLPIFFYDLGNPHCYLAAETVNSTLGVVPEWEPVIERSLTGRSARAEPDVIARGAEALGLQPVRWPSAWPPDTRMAMLAATYAKRIGRGVAFSLAAFRQAFAGGRDLGEENTVLIAGAACEMHPAALLKGLALQSVQVALDDAVARAHGHGVSVLPAIVLDGRTFSGPAAVQEAARAGTEGPA